MIWEMMGEPRRPSVLAGTKHRPPLLAEAVYLDTETSHNYDIDTGTGSTWVYQWAFRWCRQLAIGRTPEQLLDALDWIDRANGLTEQGMTCVIFIHNASYDLSYLIPFFVRRYGEVKRMLATSAHKIISMECGPWDVRCTYRLSNRSLYKWGKDLGIRHGKKKGMIDYDVLRYQDTPLRRRDWVYQVYDVIALEECVLKEMEAEGDTLRSIPLTSTGYIRREARKLAREQHDRKEFVRTKLSPAVYKAARFAFAGGLTHGNRFFSGKIVTGRIRHRDFRSMYPSELRARENGFPAGPWSLYYGWEPDLSCTWEELDELAKTHCLLITAVLGDMEVKRGVTLPYLQISKCLLGSAGGWECKVQDNGRVIRSTGRTCVTFTELDWEIIRRQYDGEITIMEVYQSERGPIPKYLADVTDLHYMEKTVFKDKVKELDAAEALRALIQDAETSLTKSKNRLNGISGMSATDPVRLDYTMDVKTGEWTQSELTGEVIEEKLDRFYKSRNSFMRYQVGIYVTALARRDLIAMYELIGPERFLYGDTDSIFYLSDDETEARIEAENRRRYEHAIAIGAYIEHKDKKITYDAFELEKHKGETERITRFVFLHAKAYAYETDDGELHVTVAGVAARDKKGFSREQELGRLENFVNGFVFRRCGSTTSVYLYSDPEILEINGHRIETAGGCVLLPTTKTLHDEIHQNEDVYWVVEATRREVKG